MSGINFTMLRDLVMIYPIQATVQTDTGLVVTAIDRTAPKQGAVVAVGPGREKNGVAESLPYKMGDRVIYSMSDAKEVKSGKETFHVVQASQILCKLSA